MLDILITGAMVYDGTGSPWRHIDVGIRRTQIAVLGRTKQKTRKTIDARNLVLCPGFIDVHTHAQGILTRPAAENVLRQGVTTVVSGNCGGSGFPVAEHLDAVEAARPGVNYATLIGHGTIRRLVMGLANRKPTATELARMCRSVAQAMRHGALGISTGLFYVPGAYAQVPELVELSKVVADFGGLYVTHKRSAGGKVFDALREAARIGAKANIPIEISHLKVLHRRGRTRPDRIDRVLEAISRYRDAGIEMTCDVHPYPATCTGLSAVTIPSWVATDDKLAERLRTPAIRRRIRKDVVGKIAWIGGPDRITIVEFKPDVSIEGLALADVARLRRSRAPETAMDLVAQGDPTCIFHALRGDDVAKVVCHPNTMIASDGGVVLSRNDIVHPRHYGTFPRIIREYVRQKRLLSLADAIRKMTSMPARKFNIPDRGILALGAVADLILFDPDTFADRTTFEKPHAFAAGLKYVIVNGHVAWNGGTLLKTRTGSVIRRR